LDGLLDRVKENGIKGLMLILDEINGITRHSQFAHFIKALVDENALSQNPLPLMLMLCGVEERRREMIEHHQPIERIFDIVEIKPMDEKEMKDFFNKAFGSVGMKVEDKAMSLLCHYSAGFLE
jgi:DNA polymerase III delta subunit